MDTAKRYTEKDFSLAQKDAKLTDLRFDTKPIGYFKDAWIRFRKSRAAVVGAIIIILIVLFGIFMPIISDKQAGTTDMGYRYMRPYSQTLSHLNIATGTYTKENNTRSYVQLSYLGIGASDYDGNHSNDYEKAVGGEYAPIRKVKSVYTSAGEVYHSDVIHQYYEIGFQYLQITKDVYENIRAYEEANTGIRIIYPMVDIENVSKQASYRNNANYWYRVNARGDALDVNGEKITEITAATKIQDAYLRDESGKVRYFNEIGSTGNDYQIRVLYWNYYRYCNQGRVPSYLLGTDASGRDIAVRLASGIRLSLILAVSTFIVNFVIGAIYGSIEGYYGGVTDLIMERISDILSNIPFIVLASIVNISLIQTGKMNSLGAIIFAFVLTGWIGPAYRVRTQFYRFKNEEYVLAARTLGASDARIMFKHIFPNTLGTIITASVLTIPGTIFTESMLSYLSIINFNQGNISSLGTMLSDGQAYMTTYPHMIVPPALIISLLMISFNLFGNGLRDAFNPSLRGVEE